VVVITAASARSQSIASSTDAMRNSAIGRHVRSHAAATTTTTTGFFSFLPSQLSPLPKLLTTFILRT
jgi:predicted RND superfamily exporter protein